VVDGDGRLDADGATYKMSKGDILFFGAGTKYRIRPSDDKVTYIILNFDFTQEYSHLVTPIFPKDVSSFKESDIIEAASFEDIPELSSPIYMSKKLEILDRMMEIELEYSRKILYFEKKISNIFAEILTDCVKLEDDFSECKLGDGNDDIISERDYALFFLNSMKSSIMRYESLDKNKPDYRSYKCIEADELATKFLLFLALLAGATCYPFILEDKNGFFYNIAKLLIEPLNRINGNKEVAYKFLYIIFDSLKEQSLEIKNSDKKIIDLHKSYENKIYKKDMTIETLSDMLTKSRNMFRWATVPDVIHFIYEEKLQNQSFNRSRHKTSEDIQTEIESRIRGTHRKLKSMGSKHHLKSNREGNYYRLPDIVEAVIQCGYVVELHRETIINNMNLTANSKTESELKRGNKISERNE
jgi:hypothetical protein